MARIFALILMLISFNIMAQNVTDFDLEGHRGCRGLQPENTIPAFLRAIDIGVNTLEMDVVISKDHKVVVSHEPYFNPEITTKPDGSFFANASESNLYLMDYSEIKKYDVGLKFNPKFPYQAKISAIKPLMTDVIKQVKVKLKAKGKKAINYNIEIKSLPQEYNKSQPEVGVFCDLVLKAIGNKINQKNLVLQSFDFNVLKYLFKLKSENPKYKFQISALIEPEENNDIDYNLDKLGFKPDIWSPYFVVLSKSTIEKFHQLKIRVIPWTVNEISDMKNCLSMGCDGIISDYPDRAIELKPN